MARVASRLSCIETDALTPGKRNADLPDSLSLLQ